MVCIGYHPTIPAAQMCSGWDCSNSLEHSYFFRCSSSTIVTVVDSMAYSHLFLSNVALLCPTIYHCDTYNISLLSLNFDAFIVEHSFLHAKIWAISYKVMTLLSKNYCPNCQTCKVSWYYTVSKRGWCNIMARIAYICTYIVASSHMFPSRFEYYVVSRLL